MNVSEFTYNLNEMTLALRNNEKIDQIKTFYKYITIIIIILARTPDGLGRFLSWGLRKPEQA